MTDIGEACASAKIDPKIDPSNCKFCRREGMTLLPLRYGTVGCDDLNLLSPVPGLGDLGEKVKQHKLTESKYTVRLLRPGYLYTLEERKGNLHWSGFKINPRAQLQQFKVEEDAPLKDEPFQCDTRDCSARAAAVTIPKPEEVPNFYLLYTVDPLSPEKLAEYKKNAATYAGEGKLQVIHPASFAPNPAQHTLKPADLSRHVLEYWLYDEHKAGKNIFNAAYAGALQDLLFPPFVYAGSSVSKTGAATSCIPAPFERLGGVRDILTRGKGAGVVLFDPIGITQEVNNFRNDAFNPLNEFLKKHDEYGVENLRKFIVHKAIDEIRQAHEKGIIQSGDHNYEYQKKQNERQYQSSMQRAQYFRMRGATEMAEREERRANLIKQRRDQFNEDTRNSKPQLVKEVWDSKYAKHLDQGEMREFQSQIDAETKQAVVTAEKRADDHLGWLKGKELVNAFETYDRQLPLTGQNINALGFYAQTSLCLFGMEGTKKGADQLDQWITSLAIPRENLYLRSVFFNNEELEKAAATAMAKAKQLAGTVEDVSSLDTKINDTFKKVISGFKSVDSAWDEWMRNQNQYKNFQFTKEGDIYHSLSNISRSVFRRGAGGKLDKGIAAALGGVLYSSLGELTQDIEFKAIMDKTQAAHPEKFADGHKGRSAERNTEMAGRHADKKADKIAGKTNQSLNEVVDDARKYSNNPNLGDIPSKEITPANQPSTNNYHQVRIGVALGGLEMLSLGLKWRDLNDSWRSKIDFAGSLLALASITADTGYAALKNVREQSKLVSVATAADIQRGGWKLAAGSLGALAGGCSAVLDFMSINDELHKYRADKMLVGVYVTRGGFAVVGLGVVAIAAFSYTGPLISHLVAKNAKRYGVLRGVGELAKNVALLRVTWLIRLARFNLIGLGITAIEIIYRVFRVFFMDNELQTWCKMNTFRKEKIAESALTKYTGSVIRLNYVTDSYDSTEKELEELYKAFQEVK